MRTGVGIEKSERFSRWTDNFMSAEENQSIICGESLVWRLLPILHAGKRGGLMDKHTFVVGDRVLYQGTEGLIVAVVSGLCRLQHPGLPYVAVPKEKLTLLEAKLSVVPESRIDPIPATVSKPTAQIHPYHSGGRSVSDLPTATLRPGAKVRLRRNYAYPSTVLEGATGYLSYTRVPISSIGKVTCMSSYLPGFCEVLFPGFKSMLVMGGDLEVLNETSQQSAVESTKEFRLREPAKEFTLFVDDMSEPP